MKIKLAKTELIHFVGIGGIGMSGIAEIMHGLGYKVQGSDVSENPNIMRLKKLGIKIKIGHSKKNINNVGVVVVSSAINFDNPELIASRENFIPVVKRAEMLAELMRFKWSIAVGGTHGKTTTTSMVASVLESAQFDPTVINGGIINAYNTNARKGSSDWMVVEADESDGSFVKLPATVAIVTNIDPEHLDFYKNFDNERKAFKNFVENIPFYGFACMCIDHPEVQVLCSQVSDRRIITYGLSSNADLRAENIKIGPGGSEFDLILNEPIFKSRRINNVGISINYAAFPRSGIGTETFTKMVGAWCSNNPKETITMLKKGEKLKSTFCDSQPIAKHYAIGNKIGVTGTPAIVSSDGELFPGYYSAEDLLKKLKG